MFDPLTVCQYIDLPWSKNMLTEGIVNLLTACECVNNL